MTLQDEAKKIRRSITKLTAGQKRRFGPNLRARILSWIDRAKADARFLLDDGLPIVALRSSSESLEGGATRDAFGCNYDPTPDGISRKNWLEYLAGLLTAASS